VCVADLTVEVSMRGFDLGSFSCAGASAGMVYRRPLTLVGAYVPRVDFLSLKGPARPVHRISPSHLRVDEHASHSCSRENSTWERAIRLSDRLVPHGGKLVL